jgi:hypothetical protein
MDVASAGSMKPGNGALPASKHKNIRCTEIRGCGGAELRAAAALFFLVRPAHHDLQRIIGQRSLQCLRFVPWRSHPHVALLIGRQDHRHRLRTDRLDLRIRHGGQETIAPVNEKSKSCAGTRAIEIFHKLHFLKVAGNERAVTVSSVAALSYADLTSAIQPTQCGPPVR